MVMEGPWEDFSFLSPSSLTSLPVSVPPQAPVSIPPQAPSDATWTSALISESSGGLSSVGFVFSHQQGTVRTKALPPPLHLAGLSP